MATPFRRIGFALTAAAGIIPGGCTGPSSGLDPGPYSTLDPAGPLAALIAQLWWVLFAGAVAILGLVLAFLVYAFLRSDRPLEINEARWVIGGGFVFPITTLVALLIYSLIVGEQLLARDKPGVLRVDALARQFHWEFTYPERAGAAPSRVLTIPVGQPVNVRLASEDVIHTFWAPRLGPKLDAIPGHVNVVRIIASSPGIYRGLCAEYCGFGHADMGFIVEALPAEEFARLLSAGPARHADRAQEEAGHGR